VPTNETILRKVQAGIETTRGTPVAATRKVYAQVDPSYNRPLIEFTDTTGTFSGRRRVGYGRPTIGFSATDILTYEDAAWWFLLGIKGGVAGVGDAGSPKAYTYTFVPTPATDDLAAVTLEHGEPGNAYKTAQVMCNSFTIRADGDSTSEPGWMIETELVGLDWVSSAYTGSIADRTTEVVLAQGTKLYIDASGGTIGTTQVTGKLISFSATVNNNIHFKAFMENVGSYAPNKVGRGNRTIDAQFVMEFDSDAEFANYRATVPVERLIRVTQTGSKIHSTPDVYKELTLDMYGYWSSWDDGDRDGNITATFGFSGYVNATAATDFSAKVVNGLMTLP